MSLAESTPVCANCNVFMRCEKNGQLVHDPDCSGGHDRAEEFTYWTGDLWGCPLCPTRIVSGFGSGGLHHAQAKRVWGDTAIETAIPFRWNP